MSYTRQGDTVTVKMSLGDYDRLLLALGMAAGVAHRDNDLPLFYSLLDLANRLNAGNPNWTPYEIPAPETHANQTEPGPGERLSGKGGAE